MLRVSWVLPRAQREVRELTCQWTQFSGDRGRMLNRTQKALETASFKLPSLITGLSGVRGRRLLAVLVAGHLSWVQRAELLDLALHWLWGIPQVTSDVVEMHQKGAAEKKKPRSSIRG